MTSTKLHELIDRENPKCLYCKSEFDIHIDSYYIIGSSSRHDVDILNCRNCKEQFEITSIDDADNVVVFVFTCNDLVVRLKYDYGCLIGGKELLNNNWANTVPEHTNVVPIFNIDFTNKNKLYTKIKTYLIFS